MEKNIRVQFELPSSVVEDLKELMEDTGISTRRELFNNALTLFEWAIKQRRLGHVIGSLDEDNNQYRELQMPVLSHVHRLAKKKSVGGAN